ncbi:hypothetical protein OH491_19105 [Termitidicoccus mucosus]|jgi:hypothetical protein|uniref:Uncharacterized protein n=1 Tax=Termitidicoccus mucosus TaxID=1184151 RepID=A0A178IK02_9BACT|nr:hypothetical protein AW736_09520 [Opitutaceae bacterium TSB47]
MKTSAPPQPGTQERVVASHGGDKSVEPLPVMDRHRSIFEQAKTHLEKTLGKSPTCEDLMRLWLATATPWDVARVFESAVLDISGSDLLPLPGEDYNQSLLAL